LEGLSRCLQRIGGAILMFDDVLKEATKAKKNRSENNEVLKKRKSGGKRTDPTYKQVGAYVKKDTYLQIQKLLLDNPHQDFSDLVQELLSDYLVKHLST
jgi:hypothetical protein